MNKSDNLSEIYTRSAASGISSRARWLRALTGRVEESKREHETRRKTRDTLRAGTPSLPARVPQQSRTRSQHFRLLAVMRSRDEEARSTVTELENITNNSQARWWFTTARKLTLRGVLQIYHLALQASPAPQAPAKSFALHQSPRQTLAPST